MHRQLFCLWWVLAVLLSAAACSQKAATPTVGIYRAVLELPGGEAPFGLEVAKEEGRVILYLANGTERTRVADVQAGEGELRAVFPGYENSLHATLRRDSLKGSVTLIKAGGERQVIPLRAKLGESHRFFKDAPTDNADVAGRWEVEFTSDDGRTSSAVALFEQQHDRVTGTIITPTGDHRFLEGQVHDNEVRLSTFAGGLAYLYKLNVNRRGELAGQYWQGMKVHERLTAKRNADAELPDTESKTHLKSDAAKLDFTFRDIDDHAVSLSDERFRGKVVLVTLGGSWCPNCHDEAMFLAPFYQQNRARGLEIIGLMFERHGDFAKAAQAVRRYRKDLGIEFPTLIAGVSDTDAASQALPMLSGIYGFPTAIFIDRRGAVRKIHTGFTGPATGQAYADYVAEFRRFTDELLAEQASANPPALSP